MKESQFLAPILLESPLMFEILEKIRDKYIQDHRRQFPSDPELPEYRRAKRKLEENLKKITKRQMLTFDSMIGDKNP